MKTLFGLKQTSCGRIAILLTLHFIAINSPAQDTSKYKLRLNLPIFDFPQNTSNVSPSMNQALELTIDFYELSFWGIDGLGDKLFKSKKKNYSKLRKISNNTFKYALDLGFSQYGSELPIPLGVWNHEEFHRSVLGVNKISSKNGNWILNKWDGTVYGIADQSLNNLKASDPAQLLYAYVVGVQSEVILNKNITLNDFYKKRTLYKNALLLYNAYYVYNYFKFSTSAISDSVKKIAPKFESTNPLERDFAGADLTAWTYDMFNPNAPFTMRDSFPNGAGVNRRVGFSDLSSEGKAFLVNQKKLSLLNFINPAIFFINRIKVNQNFSFNFFAQYTPTHYGNDIAFYLPLKYKKYDLLFNLHNYNNESNSTYGIGLGLYNCRITKLIETNIVLNGWNQPVSFYDNKKSRGGSLEVKTKYHFTKKFSGWAAFNGKTSGWIIGSPYLNNNFSLQLGFNYNIMKI